MIVYQLYNCFWEAPCNSDKNNIKQVRAEEALRLSYNFNDFQQTRVYNSLNNWQQQYDIEIFKTQ